MKAVTNEVLAVLSKSTISDDGLMLSIPGGPEKPLERKMYVAVNDALVAMGGKWNKSKKAHVFDKDLRPALEQIMLTGEYSTARDTGFFETPEALADDLVRMAFVKAGDVVLEPSAGKGRIVRAILKAKASASVYVIERDRTMLDELVAMADDRITCFARDDFMDFSKDVGFAATDGGFDAVVMNPPFCKVGKGDHIDHVMRAFTFLKRGGTLVSVLPVSVIFREDRRHKDFRTWVENRGGELRDLPDGSFKESGTMVRTCTLRVQA